MPNAQPKENTDLEIRELRDDEREQAFYIGSQAFMQGSRDMSRLNHPDRLARNTYGVWDDAGLQAMAPGDNAGWAGPVGLSR